jgi:hypothetical protein
MTKLGQSVFLQTQKLKTKINQNFQVYFSTKNRAKNTKKQQLQK